MTNPVELTAHDPIIDKLNFKSYKSTVERRFERFTPEPGEPDEKEIPTPWGESLTATAVKWITQTTVGRWRLKYLKTVMKSYGLEFA